MSEKSQEVLLSVMVEPPETDADEFEIEQRFDKAIYESSKIDIRDHIGHEDFKYVWLTTQNDIKFNTIKRQSIFSKQILDQIGKVYDFTFAITITLETQYEINEFYEFMEFVEFDNIIFLTYVWKILNPKSLLDLNLESYCKTNANKIIKEVEEQLDVHPQSKLIAAFLSGFYKDAFIEWFIKNTKQNLIGIQVGILT